jgi:plastocyanin
MKTPLLIICVTVALALLGWWFVSTAGQSNSSTTENELVDTTLVEANVKVNPQPDTNTVQVQAATLTEPGFLVLREVIDGMAAQVVEISAYLEAGTYTDLTIYAGEFYTGDAELMVVVYTDQQNDQVLNDLDQPFVASDGSFVATYVATGESVPTSVFNPTQAALPTSISMGDMAMSMPTITYTNDGFEPATLEVSKGAMVHFVNESDTEMWVASDSHPAHDILPTFDQFKPGDMYMYIFEEAGEWAYHDHLTPTAVGTITVTN